MQKITILGATGSIGSSTADVLLRHPDKFTVATLVGHKNVKRMLELANTLRPQQVIMTDITAGKELRGFLPTDIRLDIGMDAAITAAADTSLQTGSQIVVAAMVGAAGVPATLAAIEAGKHVALANKECLVMAGRIFKNAAATANAKITPVDSEHAGVHQCLIGHDRNSVTKVILTASGGPFRNRSLAELEHISPAEAVAHPNWEMGAKISIDSATMMNKALELIEARWLFDLHVDQLDAVIHPQSLVHAMVQYNDGSMLAQMAEADMRAPIAYALQTIPRLQSGTPFFDLASKRVLEFMPVDNDRFPAVSLAKAVLKSDGDSLAIALNAANEEANFAFRQGRLAFTKIVSTVEQVLEKTKDAPLHTLEEAWQYDAQARQLALKMIA
ncbi:MAG: 1-deoxy-D-xylulose-5-phosphate reductoisomerase [Mariprofundales bacterium]